MIATLRKWMGMENTHEDTIMISELAEAKNVLNYEQGLYRQALLRTEAKSRSLLRTWEEANGMLRGNNRSHND